MLDPYLFAPVELVEFVARERDKQLLDLRHIEARPFVEVEDSSWKWIHG
jgi:hypothetical protein